MLKHDDPSSPVPCWPAHTASGTNVPVHLLYYKPHSFTTWNVVLFMRFYRDCTKTQITYNFKFYWTDVVYSRVLWTNKNPCSLLLLGNFWKSCINTQYVYELGVKCAWTWYGSSSVSGSLVSGNTFHLILSKRLTLRQTGCCLSVEMWWKWSPMPVLL